MHLKNQISIEVTSEIESWSHWMTLYKSNIQYRDLLQFTIYCSKRKIQNNLIRIVYKTLKIKNNKTKELDSHCLKYFPNHKYQNKIT